MSSVEHKRAAIRRIIAQQLRFQPSHGAVRVEAACDDQFGVYTLVYAGWNGGKRVEGMLLHVRLEGTRIVVEYDGLYRGVYHELIAAGVAEEDIVLAYQSERRESVAAVRQGLAEAEAGLGTPYREFLADFRSGRQRPSAG
jgi:hypothetical protein